MRSGQVEVQPIQHLFTHTLTIHTIPQRSSRVLGARVVAVSPGVSPAARCQNPQGHPERS